MTQHDTEKREEGAQRHKENCKQFSRGGAEAQRRATAFLWGCVIGDPARWAA